MKNLDKDSIVNLICSQLSKEIEENAAKYPYAEGHEWFRDVKIERVEELGKGLNKVFFKYVKGYQGAEVITDDRYERPDLLEALEKGAEYHFVDVWKGYIIINESFQIVGRGLA